MYLSSWQCQKLEKRKLTAKRHKRKVFGIMEIIFYHDGSDSYPMTYTYQPHLTVYLKLAQFTVSKSYLVKLAKKKGVNLFS